MIDYKPLADSELEYLKRSDQRILRRAAAEIGMRRAASSPSPLSLVFGCIAMLMVGASLLSIARPGRVAIAPPAAACAHADEQLRMARVFLQRGRVGDVEAGSIAIAAVAPWQGYCRRDPAVTHALERAARGGDRVRALALVDAVLRSSR